MREPLTFAALGKQLKRLWLLWLIVAVLAGLVVVGVHFWKLPARHSPVALVNYGYEGIEKGQDPSGNWFNPEGLKDEAVLAAAAEAAGIELPDGGAANLAAHIRIEGEIPEKVIDRITALSYSGDSVSAVSSKAINAYYPTTYTVTLDAAGLGYSAKKGNALLRAVLEAYEAKFRAENGYNAAFEAEILGTDYTAFDYEEAVAVMTENLDRVRRYAEALGAGASASFRSAKTGLTFQDLLSAVDALEQQDLAEISAYLAANNVTRDAARLQLSYAWRLEEEERTGEMLKARIDGLTEMIKNYKRPMGVILGTAGSTVVTGQSEDATVSTQTAAYEMPQSSPMYDYLVRRQAAYVSAKAASDARAERYRTRLAGMEKAGGSAARAEEELKRAADRIASLMAQLRTTAEDYDRQERLFSAFEVLGFQEAKSFPIRDLISACVADGLAVELLWLGVCLLLAALLASRRKKTTAAEGAV